MPRQIKRRTFLKLAGAGAASGMALGRTPYAENRESKDGKKGRHELVLEIRDKMSGGKLEVRQVFSVE